MLARYRRQYEALQSVDRMVHDLVAYLGSTGQLANTLIVFMSDNGINIGEHRWKDKAVPYEESIRVPFVVRYDPMTTPLAGSTSNALVANIDLAPTFAEIAGDSAFQGIGVVDGTSLTPLLNASATSIRQSLLLEHLDSSRPSVPTYCGLRTPTELYVRYSDGFEELYRLRSDPYELRNVASNAVLETRAARRTTKALCEPPPPGYQWPGAG
jgi:arylsulfatase A-like enzyme